MMRKIMISMLAVISLMAGVVNGQSKKQIKELKIESLTVHEFFIEEGMNEPVVESFEKFNEKGDPVEVKVLNKKGEVKNWTKYVYNDDGELTEEIFLDIKGRVLTTEKNIYSGDLRVEKQYYNSRGVLFKKKVYTYEYRQ